MRYSRQHKDETHNRLLKKAAEEFRRRGGAGHGNRFFDAIVGSDSWRFLCALR